MSPFLIALAGFGQATVAAPSPVPADIMFLFYKVFALRQMAHDRGCNAGAEDGRYNAVRKRLIAYYGPSIFSPKRQQALSGDCGVVMVYQLNLVDLERAATTAMTPKTGN